MPWRGFGCLLQIEVLFKNSRMGIAEFLNAFCRDALLDQLHFHHKDITVISFIEHGFKLKLDPFFGHTFIQLPDEVFHNVDTFLTVIDHFAHGMILKLSLNMLVN
ncbi:MAG: hypothetical protein ACD_34C00081G0001 [uncultured bacterium]|nr:MAG: hypothetical protein ACD_34C00081G0001 [uncultured bacterium]